MGNDPPEGAQGEASGGESLGKKEDASAAARLWVKNSTLALSEQVRVVQVVETDESGPKTPE